MESKYPTTKEIIYLLGMGVLLASSIVAPGALFVVKEIVKAKDESDRRKAQKEWRKFNVSYLKRNLKRLAEQKIVEVVEENGEEVIKLTSKGKTKFLRFQMEDLSLRMPRWDGKWRIVLYDISKFRKHQQEQFRRLIKDMNFFPLQKSVYLTPYPCSEQIAYLREYFGIGDEVILIRADNLEDEEVYKEYFGL